MPVKFKIHLRSRTKSHFPCDEAHIPLAWDVNQYAIRFDENSGNQKSRGQPGDRDGSDGLGS
jgi:hypothetical protein